MAKVYTSMNIFHIYAPYFQNGWYGLDVNLADDVTLTNDRDDGDRVVLNDDGSVYAHNPYTGYVVHAPNTKAMLAFGKRETKRHLEAFNISPWTDFLSDAAGSMTPDGSNGAVDIDLHVVEDVLGSPLMPSRAGLIASFQHNLTGLSALDIRYRPDGTTYIPGLSPLCRMASCVYDATNPQEAFEYRWGKTMTWVFDSKGTYTHYGRNIIKMINKADMGLVEVLATAYTVAKNRQNSRK